MSGQAARCTSPVYFQCKRYQGSVGSSKVRDFRGAMVGRGDNGLLIPTGTFTVTLRLRPPGTGRPQPPTSTLNSSSALGRVLTDK